VGGHGALPYSIYIEDEILRCAQDDMGKGAQDDMGKGRRMTGVWEGTGPSPTYT